MLVDVKPGREVEVVERRDPVEIDRLAVERARRVNNGEVLGVVATRPLNRNRLQFTPVPTCRARHRRHAVRAGEAASEEVGGTALVLQRAQVTPQHRQIDAAE